MLKRILITILLVLAFPAMARAAVTLVESNSNTFSAATSFTVTLASAAPGNLLTLSCAYSTTGKSITSVSDTSGNAWQEAGASDIWYAAGAADSAGTLTITVNVNTAAAGAVWVAEFQSSNGAWVSPVVTANIVNASASATIDPTDLTPPTANELVIAQLGWGTTSNRTLNPRPTSGWTAILGARAGTAAFADPLYRTNLPASPITATFPLSGSITWGAAFVAFKEPAGGAEPPKRLTTMGVGGR